MSRGVGETIGGRYRLTALVDAGGMGAVFHAIDVDVRHRVPAARATVGYGRDPCVRSFRKHARTPMAHLHRRRKRCPASLASLERQRRAQPAHYVVYHPLMTMRSFFALLVVLGLGCSNPGNPSFDLPPLGGDGKADESTTELTLERIDANGSGADWTGTLPAEGQAAVAVIDFSNNESVVQIEVEVDSGEPHLYARKVDDGSTSLELHGDSTTVSGSFGVSSDIGGGRHQLALFVTKPAGGDFVVRIRQSSACSEDTDDAEPNETAMTAAPATLGLRRGTICNGADSLDADYFSLTVNQPDRVLRVGFEHVEAFGPLNVVVDGPFGPLELSRTERPGLSFLGEDVAVAIDRGAEAAPMGSEYVFGVWGDELYNLYTLMVCLDDGLEDDGGAIGNQDEASAVGLEIGATYQGVICPIMGHNYAADEPDDADYYEVEVPADTGLRIVLDSSSYVDFVGPTDALEVSPESYELSAAPTARTVVFGITGNNREDPIEYDLSLEAI
jgi:hypothetical protein